MNNIWETCKFSDEIVSGRLELHKFAVELHDVISGSADIVYQDPVRFLANTYLTSQMQGILKDTLNRLEHSLGMPCIIIDTGFGGGKTHTLMLLYHILSNPQIGFDYIKGYNLDRDLEVERISNVQVVAIDCRDIKKATLWGEIADKLGQYGAVQEYDEPPKAISDLDVIKGFFGKPTLLMIDELPHYLSETLAEKIGDTTKSKLTEAFLYKLISAVSSSKNSVLVLTLTENQQLYKDRVDDIKSTLTDYVIDGAIGDLRETLSRQTSIRNPVQKEEIYSVVRHRLVKEIDDKARRDIIQEYMDYYTQEGLIVDPKFQERFEKSYPIHPDFIDMLYDRVSTISQFNQTRGTLRFLALVLNSIYEKRTDCRLVGTGDIDLESPAIMDEITAKIDRNEFTKIINIDCIEHARDLDSDKPVKIIEQIARTIYLHSLHETPSKRSGITTSQLKLAIGKPGLDTAIVENSLQSIKMQFWYIQETNGQFYFMDAVNENAIIAEYAKHVNVPEIDGQILDALRKLTASSPFKPTIWSTDIEDTRSLKLCVFKYDEPSNIETQVSDILEHAGNNPRNYPNTIAFVYADPGLSEDLRRAARELAAICKAKKDERIKADRNFLRSIGQKETQAQGNLKAVCIKAYCKVGYPDGREPRLDVISYGDMTGRTISELVTEFLRSKGKLIPEVGRDAIHVDTYKKLEDVYNEFLSVKRKKFVEEMSSVLDAAKDAILSGAFGYSDDLDESKQIHEGTISEYVDVKFSGYIIHKDYLETKPIETETKPIETTFEYKILISNLTDVLDNIDSLLVGEFDNIEKYLQIKIEIVGNTNIALSSKLGSLNGVRNIITNLRSYQQGECKGYLALRASSDISGILKESNMVYE